MIEVPYNQESYLGGPGKGWSSILGVVLAFELCLIAVVCSVLSLLFLMRGFDFPD